ncbi:hypothetical protein BU24DRAFT_423345 [Aaosphaeria arxii CBS 175.79]|uniref:Uncharacterized protein n=1 Tax=Aaosphaeria arxii CBS 175.79 TaxID=1450172 RepID=A0A6A5XNR7_9PLEO|nr:uncharacterized protein BU24DRAFT_423345 [Aaosphaeria arxii CBS 175.79]KAF2014380.1 hypothetical protein BU24DRAFT_423345 [Aaosphaeria arxii CBS 175.79]
MSMQPASMASMAGTDAPSLLLAIPLEVRHVIFEHAAERQVPTKKLLRRWLERRDLEQKVLEHNKKNHSKCVAFAGPVCGEVIHWCAGSAEYVVSLAETGDETESDDYDSDDIGSEDEDNARESESEDENEDEDEDEAEADADTDDAADSDLDNSDDHEGEVETDDVGHNGENGETTDAPGSPYSETINPDEESHILADMFPSTGNASLVNGAQNAGQQVEAGAVGTQDDDSVPDPEQHNNTGEGDDGGADVEARDDAPNAPQHGRNSVQGAATNIPISPHPIYPHAKWRHIPRFVRMSHPPPALSLLLTNKELRNEAMEWYYEVATLRIYATASIAHMSMFELALSQLEAAGTSPLDKIRKVEILFVWDTEWMRDPRRQFCEIWEVFVRLRADAMVQALLCAPALRSITIAWHDTVCDAASTTFKLSVLDKFDVVPADIKIEEHYLEPGTKPKRRSVLGRQRAAFQEFFDDGCHWK